MMERSKEELCVFRLAKGQERVVVFRTGAAGKALDPAGRKLGQDSGHGAFRRAHRVERQGLGALHGEIENCTRHAKLFFEAVGNTRKVVKIKKALPLGMKVREPAHDAVLLHEPLVHGRYQSRHSAPAGRRFRKEVGHSVDARAAIAFRVELIGIEH